MQRVRIRNKRTGREKEVREREARILVQLGRWEPADKPRKARRTAKEPPKVAKPADTLEEMSYNDLRSLAAVEGVEVEGRKKDDYLRALRTYRRRDMQAE